MAWQNGDDDYGKSNASKSKPKHYFCLYMTTCHLGIVAGVAHQPRYVHHNWST